jgi:hypothetical protein
MIGTRYKVPKDLCDSEQVQCMSTEPNHHGEVDGDTILWCESIVAGQPYGIRFPVGRIELNSWTAITPSTEEKLAAAQAEIERLRK